MDERRATANDGRDAGLDGIRGLAAATVVAYHGIMAFLPGHCGYLVDLVRPGSLALTAFYGPLNGSAAVIVFFVLSGYVLALPTFGTGDAGRAADSAARRVPRLALPVLLATLLAWLPFALGAYRTEEAAALSGSPWLATFGEAEPWPFDTGLAHALADGLWRTLLLGDHQFNPALWTMRAELLGSLAVLAAAAASVPGPAARKAALWIAALASVATLELAPFLAFAAGAALAAALARGTRGLPLPAGLAACAVALLLLGVNDAQDVPARLAAALPGELDAGMAKTLAHVLAGVLLVGAAAKCAPLAVALSRQPFAYLGRVSLPLYLVHLPVTFSLGTWFYVAVAPSLPHLAAGVAAILVSLGTSLALATPLAYLDRSWVRFLRRLRFTAIRRRALPRAA